MPFFSPKIVLADLPEAVRVYAENSKSSGKFDPNKKADLLTRLQSEAENQSYRLQGMLTKKLLGAAIKPQFHTFVDDPWDKKGDEHTHVAVRIENLPLDLAHVIAKPLGAEVKVSPKRPDLADEMVLRMGDEAAIDAVKKAILEWEPRKPESSQANAAAAAPAQKETPAARKVSVGEVKDTKDVLPFVLDTVAGKFHINNVIIDFPIDKKIAALGGEEIDGVQLTIRSTEANPLQDNLWMLDHYIKPILRDLHIEQLQPDNKLRIGSSSDQINMLIPNDLLPEFKNRLDGVIGLDQEYRMRFEALAKQFGANINQIRKSHLPFDVTFKMDDQRRNDTLIVAVSGLNRTQAQELSGICGGAEESTQRLESGDYQFTISLKAHNIVPVLDHISKYGEGQWALTQAARSAQAGMGASPSL